MWRICGENNTSSQHIFVQQTDVSQDIGVSLYYKRCHFKITHVKTCLPIQMFHNRIDDALSIRKELQTLDEPELKTQMLGCLKK